MQLKQLGANWKRNGKFIFKSTGIKIIWNGMELEWNWNGNFTTNEIDAKWNGNGMEMDWK